MSSVMFGVLQGNMNGTILADLLLDQLACESDSSVVLLSEPLRNRNRQFWFTDDAGRCAIWLRSRAQTSMSRHGKGNCHVWVKCGDTTFISCYLSPNDTIGVFTAKLASLEETIREASGNIIFAGDLNARAVEWGMPTTNRRGTLILEMAARTDLVVMNSGNNPTYVRPGFGESIPDVTFASAGLVRRVGGWRVMDGANGSDHNYITFQVRDRAVNRPPYKKRPLGWNVSKMDEDRFVEYLCEESLSIPAWHGGPTNPGEAEILVKRVTALLRGACDASMPRKRPWKGKRSVHWWNEEIAEIRRICHRARRRRQRAHGRPELATRSAEYKEAKHRLSKAIRLSKARCLRSLRDDINSDPWGLGYKIVMGKLNSGSDNTMDEAATKRIVDALFPDHPNQQHPALDVPREQVPLFSEAEMLQAIRSMKNRKAPGPDGIPAEALKVAAKVIPGLLLGMFNACLVAGVFPRDWKVARLALISKGKGEPGSPSSYRPLCMLNIIGKVMESMVRGRLRRAIREAGDLSDDQHGFREGRSTIGAIEQVVKVVMRARRVRPDIKPDVLLVTLDVKNAFNSAKWDDMLHSLEQVFSVPDYLRNILRSYLRDRYLHWDTLDGKRGKVLSAGIAQGSVLGPDLWNAYYDGLLRIELPDGCSMIGYADDVALTITARETEDQQNTLDEAMRLINRWMSDHGLRLAVPKTEIVLLTRRRVDTIFDVSFDDGGNPLMIQTKPSVKYLGVFLDNKLTYNRQFQQACEKAGRVTKSLSWLMTNIGGPRSGKRRLLMTTVNSILLYGAEVWADNVRIKKYCKKLKAVQRQGALRIACSYKTVSEPAIQVVARVIPIDLLALERQAIYNREGEEREVAFVRARSRTMECWQHRWNGDPRGRWTHRLIIDLEGWMNRDHGEVDFYLTQFLTGHGYFRDMLFKWRKVASPECLHCPGEPDTAEHTFFGCPHFAEGRPPFNEWRPEGVIPEMLRSTTNWYSVAEYVRATLVKKKEEDFLS